MEYTLVFLIIRERNIKNMSTARYIDVNVIHVLVRNSANATWPCCRTGTPRRLANEFGAACLIPGPSGPSATGLAGRVLGTARYCFASSTSASEKHTVNFMSR